MDRLVKYLDVDLSEIIKYRRDTINLFLFNSEEMLDSRVIRAIKNSETNQEKKKEFIKLYTNGLYISLDNDNNNEFLINPVIDEKISNEDNNFYLITFQQMKIINIPYDKQQKNVKKKDKDISINEFSDFFRNMAREKAIYIKGKAIINSGIISNMKDNASLVFPIAKHTTLVSTTKKELMDKVENLFFSETKMYDSKDKKYLYKIQDNTDLTPNMNKREK